MVPTAVASPKDFDPKCELARWDRLELGGLEKSFSTRLLEGVLLQTKFSARIP